MSIFDIFRRQAEVRKRPRANAEGTSFTGMDDPRLLEYIRRGQVDGGGGLHSLRNMAVLRCVTLICESIGMLPLNLLAADDTKAPQTAHPAFRLMKLKPNTWQTPYEFKSVMQLNLLAHGNAYARIVRSGPRPVALIPLQPGQVQVTQGADYSMAYRVEPENQAPVTLGTQDVLHLRDLSADGVLGMSRLRLTRKAIDLAQHAEDAALRVFRTGVMAGGAVEVPTPLSDTAYKRMKDSLASEYSGSENASKWMLLEEGAKANQFGPTSASAQNIENRNAQIQEVARAFGVPRPLLMMDDTSWGSGIEQLGIYFIQYGLAHWLTAWEQACARSLLGDAELGGIQFKFNERALMRGTFADQSGYLSKALGSGGTKPWITVNEARDLQDMPASRDAEADDLRNPMTQKAKTDEPPSTP
ncbi:MAG: phage portal protein [Rhodanobacteraceae bacterium]